MSKKGLAVLGASLLLGCGGGGHTRDGGGGTGGGLGGGVGGEAAIGGGGAGGPTDADPGSPPTAADLQGAWYALIGSLSDGGVGMVTHKRIRFDGSRYFVSYNGPRMYCAETGSFQIAGDSVAFDVGYSEGYGPCLEGPPRTETVRWTNSGIAFESGGTSTAYARIRGVPKVFATVETHNGAFADDSMLPGTNAIAKADAFCDQSIAKPDGGRYRAIFWDDVNRHGPGGSDWILRTGMTYFQADGVRNVFTTDARGFMTAHQPILADDFDDILYFWDGNGCAGWTSANSSSTGPLANATQIGLGGVGGGCNWLGYGVLCVGDGEPINAGAGGSSDGGTPVDGGPGGSPDLQGAWRAVGDATDGGVPAVVAQHQRLRFDGNRYYLISNIGYSYCGEVGTYQASANSIRFAPEREEGWNSCTIGDVRDAALTVTSAGISLSFEGVSSQYVRADAVSKVFLTPEIHDGDFADDATLAGGNAIARADTFCNQSAGRPDEQSYKAVLVDGTHRGGSPAVDWVLKPNTIYFQAAGVLPMFMSNTQSLYDGGSFGAFVNPYLSGFSDIEYMWTGLKHDFSLAPDNCQGWSSLASGLLGSPADVRGSFEYAVVAACTIRHALICVSQ